MWVWVGAKSSRNTMAFATKEVNVCASRMARLLIGDVIDKHLPRRTGANTLPLKVGVRIQFGKEEII